MGKRWFALAGVARGLPAKVIPRALAGLEAGPREAFQMKGRRMQRPWGGKLLGNCV